MKSYRVSVASLWEAATEPRFPVPGSRPSPGLPPYRLSSITRTLSYGKHGAFFLNKNALWCPPPATPPPSQVIKLWCLIRVPDVCMYLFIRIFIVSLSSSLPPWVHSRNFKNIHGKATKIKDLCLVNSLRHIGLGQSLE